ncbi:MAG: hypothetical protein ACLQEQ_08010 [Nitrososphaerales archaeon]
MEHVPLLQDSPLVELLGAIRQRKKTVFDSDTRFQKVVREGLETTTSHLSNDNRQLYAFSRDWDGGSFFPTKRGIEKVLSRTSTMWFEADKYLEVSAGLKEATLGSGRQGLANEATTSSLAEFNLDLASKVISEFRRLP